MYVYAYVPGLCDNGKSDISISMITFYKFISKDYIISIMLLTKKLCPLVT